MSHIRRHQVASAIALMTIAALWSAGAVAAQELTLEKAITGVNGEAPATDPIQAAAGDTLAYELRVSGSSDLAGTEVTITDVFDANLLAFESASEGACADGAAAGEVSCTLTLGDDASTSVSLEFSVLPIEGSECSQLVNDATATGTDGVEATAQATAVVCPEGATAAASPTEGTAGGTQGSTSGGGSDQPNTALSAPGPSALLVQLGALLLGAAIIAALHRPVAASRTVRTTPRR